MNKISLIIIAMDEELNAVLNELDSYDIINNELGTLYSFNKNDVNYIMTLGKIGKVSTAFFIGKLSMQYNIERIFNIGTSGALTDKIDIGDVVVASRVVYHDVDVLGFGYEEGQIPSCPKVFASDEEYIASKHFDASQHSFKIVRGLIASGDKFVTKNNYDLLSVFAKENAVCAEMESGAVAQCAYLLNVPFVVIRSISDYVLDYDNGKKMDSNMTTVCSNCAKVLLKYI